MEVVLTDIRSNGGGMPVRERGRERGREREREGEREREKERDREERDREFIPTAA